MERYSKGRLKLLEEGLQAQIAEFKTDFSDKDVQAAAKVGSSLGRIKSSEEYARDRELTLNSLLQVSQATHPTIESESMQNELSMLSRPAYSPENLPILLHQFYCDRIEQLVQLRHLHLVRWARFAVGQAKVTEEMETLFRERLELILSEYNDAVNRAKRLSVSCDQLLAGKALPIHVLCEEDILIYLRWLVYQLHCIKNTACFINNVQWLSLLYHDKFVACLESKKPKQIIPTSDGLAKSDPLQGGAGESNKWLKASQTSKRSYAYNMSKALKNTSKGQFSMATGPAQKLLGDKTNATAGGHMANLVSALMDSGLSPASTVESCLPCHQTDVGKIKELMQELMGIYSIVGPSTFQNQSDELQLYYQVIRKFHSVFQHQEHATTLNTYDRQPENGSKRNASKMTFRKPANWVTFIKIRPTPDPVQIKAFANIRRAVTDIDPLLALSSHCTNLHNVHRVLFALRQHCIAIKHPSPITPLSVSTHKTSHDTLLVWKCIYSGLDSRNPISTEDENGFDSLVDTSESDDGENPSNPKGNEFEVAEAVKLIHNNNGRRVSSKAHSAPKDAYFSFLLMRHLRIRDLRNKCLGVLNYFRSVERTLTINMEGLSLDSPHEQRPHQSGLTSHRHLFNTPADYVVNQSEFMTFMEVENHDDFYSFDKDSQVKVWDPSGVGVVYDVALDDLKQLEAELQVVGSYYLSRCLLDDQDKKRQTGKLKTSKFRTAHAPSSPQDIDMDLYSERNVDRFALLMDLWNNEVQFLEAKMKVINCYLECYAHTYDKLERQRLAQTITTYLHRRPRYDAGASYFTTAYEAEVKCLKMESQLLQDMINYQLMEERTYNQQICSFGSSIKSDARTSSHSTASSKSHSDSPTPMYGLPPPLIAEQLISLSGDRKLLIHSHLLEFSGSLSVLASLPQAIQWTLSEVVNRQEVTGSDKILSLHCKLLELLLHEWEERSDVGSDHTPELQQQLFAGVSAEDPHLLVELCVTHSNQAQVAGGGAATPIEQTRMRIQGYTDVLQLVSLRHHLLTTCSECETLTKLYKKQLTSLDNEECHAHLRCVPFDLSLRLPGDKTLDQFVSQAREVSKGDSRLDRYNPAKLHLAVQELDEKHVGCFSFRTKGDITKVLSGQGGIGLENVRVSVESQVAHRNALVAACQQNAGIVKRALALGSETSEDVPPIKSRTSQVNGSVPTPQVSSSTVQMEHDIIFMKKLKRKFISLQQEKAPVRDLMLAHFTTQASSAGRTPEELVKLKCKLISQFSLNLSKVFTSISLRSQIMRQYDNVIRLLTDFPAARDSHFILGKQLEFGLNGGLSSVSVSSTSSLRSLQLNPGVGDPRQHLARPFALLTKDGKRLMNLWYLPHYTEILAMFCDLSIEETNTALYKVVRLVTSLHTLLQYFCAYVQLGGHAHCNHGEMDGAWGGKEGIGSELLQLQSELTRLADPADPVQVVDYLSLRCQVAYLQHNLSIRHNLRKALIMTGNVYAAKILDSVSMPALLILSQPTPCTTHTHPYPPHLITAPHLSHLPMPLNINQSKSYELVPWHSRYAKQDCPFNLAIDHSWIIGSFIYASLACLGPVEQSIAQGKLLGLSLLLDDVLQSSDLAKNNSSLQSSNVSDANITRMGPPGSATIAASARASTSSGGRTSGITRQGSFEPTSRVGSGLLKITKQSSTLNNNTSNTLSSLQLLVPPLEGLQLMKEFLVKLSQLEVLKMEWGMKMLRLHSVMTQGHAELLENAYKDKVLSWVRKMVAKQQMRDLARIQAESEMTESVSVATFITETSTTDHASSSIAEAAQELSENISEVTLRNMQVCRLLELLEQRMIQDTTKLLSRLHHLMLNERERDDATLPLDLWKTAAMNFKEITGLPRSHVVEEFTAQLQKKLSDRGESVTIPKAHLKECLHQLSSGVLAREKECYHLYASYYEALLKSQYNQLYQKKQEISHYKWLLENHAHQSKEENMLFVGEQTQSLVMEVTALRCKVADLHQQLNKKDSEVHKLVQQEYQQLVSNLFSASLAVKNRFEGYRGDLYSDMTKSLHEVRQSVAESVTKMKEKLGLQDQIVAMTTNGKAVGDKAMETDANTMVTALKAEGMSDIQQENAELSKMVIRMRAVNKWNRHKADIVHDDKLLSLQAELDSAHQSYLELKMCTEEEVQSLKHQLQAAQKSLGRIERDYEVMRQTMNQERHKKSTTSKTAARSHESHLSKLDKAQGIKLDQLKQELDEKEKRLRQLGMDFDLTQKLTTAEKARSAKTLKNVKQQVTHERYLKLDAFHEVDKLINQVQDYELQQQSLLKSSFHPLSRGLATMSGSCLQAAAAVGTGTSAPPTAPARLGLASTSQSRMTTPTTAGARLNQQQGRAVRSYSSVGSEKIDLSQEILALKLI